MDETNETQEPSLDAATVIAIARHYCRARAKHPYFADRIVNFGNNDPKPHAVMKLKEAREILHDEIKDGCVQATTVANVEAMEIIEAYARGDKEAAVAECYDTIAVMLRIIDVLEGRQALGLTAEEDAAMSSEDPALAASEEGGAE